MNSQSLTDTLFNQLQGDNIHQISQQLGLNNQQTSQAVSAALPLLMGALGKNASTAQGAQSLLGALQNDHAGFDMGDIIGAVLGGNTGSRQTNGAGILGHIFGGNSSRAANGLGQATGLESGKANQLLMILAPIVLSFLAQRFFKNNQQQADAGQLSQVLGQEQAVVRQNNPGVGGLLGSVLDRDGDGEVGLGDLVKMGTDYLGKR